MHALVASRRSDEHGAVTVAVGIVAALVLILSGAAVVQLSSSNLRGVFASSDTRQARGAAAEGTELMINYWNLPQNRRLLVSGESPTDWSAANLRSPCFNTEDGSRPGPSNNGLPDQEAINLGDGQWRDVVTGAAGGAGPNRREFRLVRITYSASDGRTNPDPRALRRTGTPGGAITGSALPTGFARWDQLVNLNDPDGAGALQSGRNSGFLVLEVEGRVVRGGQVVANSRETREFEVLPKCCGASLGSNSSGGTNYQGTTGSLGSDSRLCNLQYGVVTGLNDGWHWSFFANDQFTQRSNDTGSIVPYGPILGVVDNAGDLFERSNCRVRPGRGKLASGNCPRTNDTSDSDVGDDTTFNSSIVGAGAPDANERVCRQTGPATYFSGPETDIRGTSASCSPIVALETTAFPDIDDFVFAWTEDWGPDLIIEAAEPQDDKLLNVALWPLLSTDNGDGSTPANSETTLRLRTNNEANRQRVEVCLVDLDDDTTADNCTANTWLNVTSRGRPNSNFYGLGDSAVGSQAPLDFGNPSNTPTDLTILGAASWNSNPNDNDTRLYRDVNLNSFEAPFLQTPFLEFSISRTSDFDASDLLVVEVSPNNGINWYPLTPAPIPGSAITTSTSGTLFRLGLPFSGSDVRVQFRDGATTSSNQWQTGENITIRNLRIQSSQPTTVARTPTGVRNLTRIFGGAWCQFTNNSPITLDDGFHCLGPTINQRDGGRIFIDTSGGPLSFFYTEPATTDLRFGVNNVNNTENFIFTSRSPAELAHVLCPDIRPQCDIAVDDDNYEFSPVGEPDRLNFFGRDTGAAGQEQNILITTSFGTNAKIGGVWFYLPRGRAELRVTGGAANDVPAGFYTNNEDNWSFFGRIWVSQFKPYGAFHLRVPDSRVTGAALGEANPAKFVPWNGIDWVARATTNTRLW
ncbi:MAG: hypothetical protein FJ054_07860 [Cyanobacteria bacterium M_surface_10_m2_119]|nr:hypothetical protein [Cyanobacteria bacterium M_surface_10_m2_119]